VQSRKNKETIMNVKLTDLTLAGWLLALTTVALIAVLMVYAGSLFTELIPGAKGMPVLLAVPGPIIGILFFGIGAFALRLAGVRVIRKAAR
jgi:hypothetical protein